MTDPYGGASWKGRKATRLQPSSREIKMLRPICQTCEDEAGGVKYLQPGWWNDCTHDPYVSYAKVEKTEPVYEDLEDGTKRLTGTETIATFKPVPNWTSVTQAAGVNGGKGPDRALRKGYIYPQQLVSTDWPEGIKRRCQFANCYEDEGLVRYNSGWFCREFEAKMVRITDLQKPLRGDFGLGEKARMAREEQIDGIRVAL